jgi:hypothetical protein
MMGRVERRWMVVSSLKDDTHPAQSVLKTGCGIGAGETARGK